jgi:hypothetical protein
MVQSSLAGPMNDRRLVERALDQPGAREAFDQLKGWSCPEDELRVRWTNAVREGIRLWVRRYGPVTVLRPRSRRRPHDPGSPYDLRPRSDPDPRTIARIANDARTLATDLGRINASGASPLRWERIPADWAHLRGLFVEQERVRRAFLRVPGDLRSIALYLEGSRTHQALAALRHESQRERREDRHAVARQEALFVRFVKSRSKKKRWEQVSVLLGAAYEVALPPGSKPPVSTDVGALRERHRQFEKAERRQVEQGATDTTS